MKRILQVCGFIGGVFCCLSSWSHASAWNRAKDEYYIQQMMSYGSTSKVYDLHGNSQSLSGTYRSFMLQLYGEWAVTDWVTVLGSVPWARQDSLSSPSHSGLGVGDVQAGVRISLHSEKPISVQIEHTLPTGSVDGDNKYLPLGGDRYQLKTEFARGFYLPHGITNESAISYTYQGSGFSDFYGLRFQFSKEFHPKWVGALRLFSEQSLRNRSLHSSRSLVSTYLDRRSFVAMGPTVTYRISPAWATTFEFDIPLSARQVHSGIFPRLSVSYQGKAPYKPE